MRQGSSALSTCPRMMYLHKPTIAKESVYYMGGGYLDAGGTVDLLLAIVEEPGRIAGGETAREQGLCVSNGRACIGMVGRAVCMV